MLTKLAFFRTALVAAAVAAGGHASAALDPAVVPADAKWIVHSDFNALRSSVLGKELLGYIETMQREATQGTIGIDIQKVLTTVGSVTAYGSNFSKKPEDLDGTLIAQGTADLKKIAESLILQATIAEPKRFTEIEGLPYPAYGVVNPPTAPATGPSKVELVIAFPPEPIVIVSRSKERVVRAYELVRGRGASMAKAPASPVKNLLKNSENAYFFLGSIVPPDEFFTEDGPQARILKMATSGSIALGESGPETFAHAELLASSDAMAEKLLKILQGMTAMLSMAETNERQLGEFLNASGVTRNGNAVTLAMMYPSARLATMIQSIQRMQQPPQARVASGPRPVVITSGKTVSEWTAELDETNPAVPTVAVRTIENVELKNGSTITLGRDINGGRVARFGQVEIVPGSGSPLTFKQDYMRTSSNRMTQLSFPGADGVYTLKVSYTNDPAGKAKYAVSVREPRPPEAPKAPVGADVKVEVKSGAKK